MLASRKQVVLPGSIHLRKIARRRHAYDEDTADVWYLKIFMLLHLDSEVIRFLLLQAFGNFVLYFRSRGRD